MKAQKTLTNPFNSKQRQHDVQEAKVAPLRPLKTTSPIKWQGRTAPARDWLIEGVLLRRTAGLFSGSGNLGKSLMMQQLISCCAVGKPWMGMTVPRCRTFGFFAEEPENEIWRRQESINRWLDVDMSDMEDIEMMTHDDVEEPALYSVSGKFQSGKPTILWHQLCEKVKDFGAELVVIDNAMLVFEGSANFPELVRPFMALLGKLAKDINGAVILCQHPSRTGETERSGKGGSVVWFNAARSQMILEYPPELSVDDDPSDERLLRIGKNNYGRRLPPLRVEWQNGVFVPSTLSATHGGLSMLDRLELRSRIEIALRHGITLGSRYSLAGGAHNHVATELRKDKSWHRYAWHEITTECEIMVKEGKLEVVNVGPRSRPVKCVRPSDCRYGGES